MTNGDGQKLALIYRPTKNAMQSGQANTRKWVLRFEPEHKRLLDPLMGWTSSWDTETQLRLKFDTQEEAEAFCRQRNIPFMLKEPQQRRPVIKSYADNFRFTPPEA
jgi:hypothetical protein